jgi:predicted esterase
VKFEAPRRTSLSARLGLPRDRWVLRRARFLQKPRDLTILPAGGAAASPAPTVVAFHGMAMRVEIFARWLAGALEEPWAWIFPEGPYPLERRVGDLRTIGHAWYLWEGDTPEFRRSLRRSEARVLRLLDHPAEGASLDAGRRILLGFSQGGYFAGSLGLRHAECFRGIAVAGARIRPAWSVRDMDGVPRIPLLFLHGEADDVITRRDARASAQEMEDLGFPVRFETVPGGHRWNGAMTEVFRDWARGVFERQTHGGA